MAKKSTVTSEIQRPWLKSYPDNVPTEISELEHASVADLLEESCRKFSNRPAFTCMGKTMSYGELLELSAQVAAWLQAQGLVKGDRVAIMMPNVLQYPVVLMGILRAGLIVVNVNPLYTPRELKHQLSDSGAKAIFVLENFAHTFQEVQSSVPIEHVVVTKMGDMLGGLKGAIVNVVVKHIKKLVPQWSIPGHATMKDVLGYGGASFENVQTGHEDYAFLQYTGGTTGVSKGAALTNGNVLANAAQNDLWLKVLDSGKGLPDAPVYICALPLYHIFALTVNAIMGMNLGAHNVLIPNPRDIPGFVKEMANWKFHVFPGLNTLFNGLLNNEDFRKLDFSA